MSKTSQYVWICEECGREFDELPFPASCECGNYCEDFFRLKDKWDAEDDQSGAPLLGIKYDPKVLKERNQMLGQNTGTYKIVTSLDDDTVEDLTIDFATMSEEQLMNYLREKDSDLIFEDLSRTEMIKACKSIESKE